MLGYAALVVILAEGGLGTKWQDIRPVVPAAAALSTVGVGGQRGRHRDRRAPTWSAWTGGRR